MPEDDPQSHLELSLLSDSRYDFSKLKSNYIYITLKITKVDLDQFDRLLHCLLSDIQVLGELSEFVLH